MSIKVDVAFSGELESIDGLKLNNRIYIAVKNST